MIRRRRISPAAVALVWAVAALLALLGPSAFAQPEPPPADPAEAEAPEAESPETGDEAGPSAATPLSEALTGIARAEYEAARVLYSDGDYANAIVKFKKAHELSKDPRLLWNIAVCQKNLRRYSRMLRSIRRYRAEAKDLLTVEDRNQADEIVETVQQFISDLDLHVNIKGAEVLIDGESIGTTPLEGRATLDVGRRIITVRKAGYREEARTVTVPGGGKVSLSVDLLRELHRGRLVVEAGENDLVSIDGKVRGRGGWKGTLRSGGHTLKVTAPDMQPYQQEVVVEDDKTRTVRVELVPTPTDSTETVLWVIGGVALAGAAVVTSVFLFQPSSEPPVEGSINPGSVQLSQGLTVGRWW